MIVAGGRTPRFNRYDTLQNLIEGERIGDGIAEFGAESDMSGNDSRHTIKITLSDPVLEHSDTLNVCRLLRDNMTAVPAARNEPHMRDAHRRPG